MPPSAQTNKLISSLRLLIPRLRLLQKKDTASSVTQRRDLSHLLAEGRDASARIRVENVISTDIAVEVMEMVELYCELLLARANVLDQVAFGEKGVTARGRVREEKKREEEGRKRATATTTTTTTGGDVAASESGTGGSRSSSWFSWGKSKTSTPSNTISEPKPTDPEDREDSTYMDPAIDEAALAIFYAWPRFPHDVRELTIVRTLLADRYGKDFMVLAQENKLEHVRVPERLLKSLRVRPPTQELVDSYLREIARSYGVSWAEDQQQEDLGSAPLEFVDDSKDGDGSGGGDGPALPFTPAKQQPPDDTRRPSDTNELTKATPPRGAPQPGKSPVSVAPPGPRTDNPNPRVKVPGREGEEGKTDMAAEVAPQPQPQQEKDPNRIPEVDELSRRFAALRR